MANWVCYEWSAGVPWEFGGHLLVCPLGWGCEPPAGSVLSFVNLSKNWWWVFTMLAPCQCVVSNSHYWLTFLIFKKCLNMFLRLHLQMLLSRSTIHIFYCSLPLPFLIIIYFKLSVLSHYCILHYFYKSGKLSKKALYKYNNKAGDYFDYVCSSPNVPYLQN